MAQEGKQDQTISYELFYGTTSKPKIATTVAELADLIAEVKTEETYWVCVTKDSQEIGGGFYTSGKDEYNETGAAEGLMKKIEEL